MVEPSTKPRSIGLQTLPSYTFGIRKVLLRLRSLFSYPNCQLAFTETVPWPCTLFSTLANQFVYKGLGERLWVAKYAFLLNQCPLCRHKCLEFKEHFHLPYSSHNAIIRRSSMTIYFKEKDT